MLLRWWVVCISLMVGGCVPLPEPTPLPTTTLIPSTPVITAFPPTHTPTATPKSALVFPSDLDRSIAVDTQPSNITLQARNMVEYAAMAFDVSVDQVAVLEFSQVLWFSADLGCEASPIDFLTPVPIEGFRMVLKVDAQIRVLHQANGGSPKTCEDQKPLRGKKQGLILNDPIAEEFVALAKAQLVNELPPSVAIDVGEVRAYTWLDSSLGCPFPNQRYSEGESEGYRIVLRANEQEYLFHTAFDRMIRCAAEHEVLPH